MQNSVWQDGKLLSAMAENWLISYDRHRKRTQMKEKISTIEKPDKIHRECRQYRSPSEMTGLRKSAVIFQIKPKKNNHIYQWII